MYLDNSSLNKRIKVYIITDIYNDVNLEINGAFVFSIFEIIENYINLFNSSNLKIDHKNLTATFKGKLISLTLLEENLTWSHLQQLAMTRKYYSEL